MIAARAAELVEGTNYNDADYVLGRAFDDYEPEHLPESEPGAWMPRCRWPLIDAAMRRAHAMGSTPKGWS